jgi:hypothetical protein
MQYQLAKLGKNAKISIVFCSIIILFVLSLFVFDVGINSKYYITRDFSEAFGARMSGNCDKFIESVAQDSDGWKKLCLKEKNKEAPAINKYTIKEVSISGDKAFVQVELERDLYLLNLQMKANNRAEIKDTNYVTSYELIQRGLFFKSWFLNMDTEETKASKQAEEQRKKEAEEQAKKQLVSYQYSGVVLKNVNVSSAPVEYFGSLKSIGRSTITGTVANTNNFDITKLSIKFILTSDNKGLNKIGEVNCDLQDNNLGSAVFYANSTKQFSQSCSFPDEKFWFTYSVRYAEKSI